ncbi:MAG TPA: alpha-L-fucosidase [Tepidisphaeraceae bacterium]|nr:alpha-L-fucosidase [Tepidisphaeraceae bacterium]
MNRRTALKMILGSGLCAMGSPRWLEAAARSSDGQTVSGEHGMIGDAEKASAAHNDNPGAQWYPHAGFGLFLHWGLACVRGINISWTMIPGRALARERLSPDELARVIREEDWNLNGKPPFITPNEYWAQAKEFNPDHFDPEKWCQAAKEAGFVYAVLTTKHHEGFALWPSKFGNFNTTLYAGGKDLVKGYVQACRKYGLKVGLYFSGPDWHFDRDYMNFLYGGAVKRNPGLPSLDADLKPRKTRPTDLARHDAEFAALFKGQIEELLTGYGEVNVLWFDGKPNFPHPEEVIPLSRIRQLQPQIVVDGRLHGQGDFYTYERAIPARKTVAGWAELCQTWTDNWSYIPNEPYRSNGWILGELVRCRSMGINFLLGTGPRSDGQLAPEAYANMADVTGWMEKNSAAAHDVEPLPAEKASVPGSIKGNVIFLYLIPRYRGDGMMNSAELAPRDESPSLNGDYKVASAILLADGEPVEMKTQQGSITFNVPASRRTKLVDVIAVQLA